MEKVLNYSRAIVAQEKAWDCGPASAEIILNSAGIIRSEDWLIKQIGTTTAGTNHSGLITPVLNELLPGSGYTVVWLTKDPPSTTQVDTFWGHVQRSIDANRGVLLNFVSPPWFRPRPSYTSTEALQYGGNSTIYHYLAGMGIAVDDKGGRHVWLADPGFRPHGMWCRVEDVARLITPHSYAYAATAPLTKPPAKPEPPITVPVDSVGRMEVEWRATQFGDLDAVGVIVKAAQQDDRGKKALALLERVNPAALQQFIARKG